MGVAVDVDAIRFRPVAGVSPSSAQGSGEAGVVSMDPALDAPFQHDGRGIDEAKCASQPERIPPRMEMIIMFVLLSIAGMLHLLGYHMMTASSTTPSEPPALRFNGD
jgi:hypothetical protein